MTMGVLHSSIFRVYVSYNQYKAGKIGPEGITLAGA